MTQLDKAAASRAGFGEDKSSLAEPGSSHPTVSPNPFPSTDQTPAQSTNVAGRKPDRLLAFSARDDVPGPMEASKNGPASILIPAPQNHPWISRMCWVSASQAYFHNKEVFFQDLTSLIWDHTHRHHCVESLTPLLEHFLWDTGLPQKSTENHIVLRKNLAAVLKQALKNKCSLRNHMKTSQETFPRFSWLCPTHTRATGQPGSRVKEIPTSASPH